jgi:hypothetical protein
LQPTSGRVRQAGRPLRIAVRGPRRRIRKHVTHHAANLLRARLVQPLVTLLDAHLRKLSAHGGKFTLNVNGWQIGDEEHGRNSVTAD